MSSSSASRTALRSDGIPTPSQRGSEAVGLTGARKPPRRAGSLNPDDVRAAKWLDAGIAAYGKADAYAESAEIGKADLSNMRTGKISTALRRLLPMQKHAPSALAFCGEFLADVDLAEHPDEVLELVAPLLEEIGYVARPKGVITPEQVGAIAARLLTETRAAREMLERECRREHGASPSDVAMALRGEDGGGK